MNLKLSTGRDCKKLTSALFLVLSKSMYAAFY